MTLQKLAIDNSVRYVSKDDHLNSKQAALVKPNTKKKIVSDKKLSQNNKNFNKNVTAEGIRILKLKMNYYFQIKKVLIP